MVEDSYNPHPTLALNTKVEEDFVAPLTAIRGALEILRDFPHLSVNEQQRFVETALRGCQRLAQGVEHLAETVYQAGQNAIQDIDDSELIAENYRKRISFIKDQNIIELDFSDFSFSNSTIVNEFYDAIERLVEPTGRSWFFLVNYRNCSVWPEAWVAFAHRGKRLNATCSLGSVRFTSDPATDSSSDADELSTREAALKRIEELKSSR